MTDVLILNTAAVDLRRPDFEFTAKLAAQGGLAKRSVEDMPDYSQDQLNKWIADGFATAGGPGNCAPLLARAGIATAVGVNLGAGDYGGLDAQGRFFYDLMTANGVDMSATRICEHLPTGTTFLHDAPSSDRGGIVYFPGANHDFDFEYFKTAVDKLAPTIVHYMYSGLSDRGDANGGKDLAEFIRWCRSKNALTLVDSHTFTGDPQGLIAAGQAVQEYRLLEPLLPELDIFFVSSDEAKLIENTLGSPRDWSGFSEHANNMHFLDFLLARFAKAPGRTRLFGVTVSDGAYHAHVKPDGTVAAPVKTASRFMAGQALDLVGAGDSFRAGLLAYIARNPEAFRRGALDFANAVQMGNLFASLYIKAPLKDRYAYIRPYPKMLRLVAGGAVYETFEQLRQALDE